MISIYTLQASSSFSVGQTIWDPDSSKLDSQTWQAIGKSDFVYPFPSLPNVFGTLGPRLSQLVDGSVPCFIINPWGSLSYLYTDVPDSSCDWIPGFQVFQLKLKKHPQHQSIINLYVYTYQIYIYINNNIYIYKWPRHRLKLHAKQIGLCWSNAARVAKPGSCGGSVEILLQPLETGPGTTGAQPAQPDRWVFG